MKNKKRIVALAAVFLIAEFLLQAWQGKMAGAKKLYVSQTRWFDIIYAEESAQTAQIRWEIRSFAALRMTRYDGRNS